MPGESWRDKRGGVAFGPLPPVYPRNVFVALGGVGALLVFWPITGGVVAAAVGSSVESVPVESVLLAVVGVVASHAFGVIDYFRTDRYADCSPREALPGRYVLGVFVLGIGGVSVLERTTAPSALLAVVASTKLLADLLVASRSDTHTEWESSLDRPDGDPLAVFRTDRRSLLARAPGLTPLFLTAPPYVVFCLLAGLVGVFVGGRAAVGTLAAAAGLIAAGRVVGVDVERGHLEYRLYPHRIVAYDTLLDAPQWVVRRKTVERVSVETSVFDPIRSGTRTVVVSTYGGDRRLRALHDPAAFVAAVGDTDTSPEPSEAAPVRR